MDDEGYTAEGRERLRTETYMAVIEALRKFASAELRRTIESEVSATVLSDDEMLDICIAARDAAIELGRDLPSAERVMREVRRRLEAVEAMPQEERSMSYDIDDEIDNMLDMLASNWMRILKSASKRTRRGRRLDARKLGPDMLPDEFPPLCDHCNTRTFAWISIPEDRVRQILRFVRGSLEGALLPQEVIAYLALEGVKVTNA